MLLSLDEIITFLPESPTFACSYNYVLWAQLRELYHLHSHEVSEGVVNKYGESLIVQLAIG